MWLAVAGRLSLRRGGGRDVAVVGLALRFALNARPTGSQGFAAGKANDKNKSKTKTQKGDTSNEVRKGTFLKSFDKLRTLLDPMRRLC